MGCNYIYVPWLQRRFSVPVGNIFFHCPITEFLQNMGYCWALSMMSVSLVIPENNLGLTDVLHWSDVTCAPTQLILCTTQPVQANSKDIMQALDYVSFCVANPSLTWGLPSQRLCNVKYASLSRSHNKKVEVVKESRGFPLLRGLLARSLCDRSNLTVQSCFIENEQRQSSGVISISRFCVWLIESHPVCGCWI